IAAKDAVRHWLWERGVAEVFPAEITIGNDESGRPFAEGPFDDDLRLSIAHTEWLGVARVDVGRPVGIDVERVEPRGDRFSDVALDEVEAADAAGSADPDLALTRLWAVKEAVAKARGTGLEGRPRDFPVRAAEGGTFVVGDQTVSTETLDADQEARHVVAWTTP
ncbi:MAG: 4'-phosphopantetheinyl transferase superfamily protein, partial [Actinomycetota bacterium]